MSNGEEVEEFGRSLAGRFEGVSRGPGANLNAAMQMAARAAGENGYAGREFSVSFVIEPQEHNQWIKTYRVIIEER